MDVSMKREVAEELISFKLRQIQSVIAEILQKWNQPTIDDFLTKAKDGSLEEAENDAVELKQLIYDEERLQKMLQNL